MWQDRAFLRMDPTWIDDPRATDACEGCRIQKDPPIQRLQMRRIQMDPTIQGPQMRVRGAGSRWI